jgi:hypothetical protein
VTIPSTPSEISYAGDGVSVAFAIPFAFDTSADLKVIITDADGEPTVITTGFSVSGGSGSTGTLTLDAALPLNETLTILDDPELTQPVDYTDNDAFPAETHERALDRTVRQVKRLHERVDRSIRVADGDLADGDNLVLPIAATRQGKYLAFDAEGQPVASDGTGGGDESLRTDLAATDTGSEGARLVGAKYVADGATPLNLQSYIDDDGAYKLMGFVPQSLKAAIRARTGVVDLSQYFEIAKDALVSEQICGHLKLSVGRFLLETGITLDSDRIGLVGQGQRATLIQYEPSANGTAIALRTGSAQMEQPCLRGFTLFSSDPTYTKVGIDIADASNAVVENIEVAGSVLAGATLYWSGADSIGIRTRGREFGMFRNIYSVADRPFVIAQNPNKTGLMVIDIDHYDFHNFYLIANGNPCVEIESGVNLTHVAFAGRQAWVKGTNGLRWVDTAASINSNFLRISGMRTEQGEDASAYSIHIEHNDALRFLGLDDFRLDPNRNGIYLRNVTDIEGYVGAYEGASGRTAIDIDATVKRIGFRKVYWAPNSSANIAGQRVLSQSPREQSAAPLPHDINLIDSANSDRTNVTGVPMMGAPITLADDESTIVGPTTGAAGYLFIQSVSEDFGAIYYLTGDTGTVFEINDFASGFVGTDTDGSYCVFVNGDGNFVIRNRRGSPQTIRWLLIGSHEG